MVRGLADLEHVGRDLSVYLSILRRRSPASAAELVQGIWIDEKGIANPPSALVLPSASGGGRTVHILETAGINGIWMLCWLDAPACTVSRVDLAAALLKCFGHEETEAATPAVRFIPIFSVDISERCAGDEMRVLDALHPGWMLSPAYRDGNGVLRLPLAQLYDG